MKKILSPLSNNLTRKTWQQLMIGLLITCLSRVLESIWFYPLEKEMATHSSILAWKIPWTEEPGRLQSMGSQRVGHD